MTKTALQSAVQSLTNHRNRDGVGGPLTRMTHNQAPLGTGQRDPGSPGWKRFSPLTWCHQCAVTSP